MGPAGGRPAGITWSGCRQCRPCWRCQTTAGSCRAGCGPDGRSCAGWSKGSGLLARSPGVGCSPWGSVKEDSNSPGLPTHPGWHCQQGPTEPSAGLRADATPFLKDTQSSGESFSWRVLCCAKQARVARGARGPSGEAQLDQSWQTGTVDWGDRYAGRASVPSSLPRSVIRTAGPWPWDKEGVPASQGLGGLQGLGPLLSLLFTPL